MRSPKGYTKTVLPDDETNKKRKIISQVCGSIEPPSTESLIREAKLLLGQALIGCRNIADSIILARTLQHICGALARIISIDKLESIDFINMTDEQLKETAQKLLKELN